RAAGAAAMTTKTGPRASSMPALTAWRVIVGVRAGNRAMRAMKDRRVRVAITAASRVASVYMRTTIFPAAMGSAAKAAARPLAGRRARFAADTDIAVPMNLRRAGSRPTARRDRAAIAGAARAATAARTRASSKT